MKKIFLVLSLVFLLAAGCSQKSATNSSAQSPTTNQAVANNLDLQSQCGNQSLQALGNFQNSLLSFGDKASTNFNQSNHYNQKQNKCFVLISFTNSPTTISYVLEDAYENITLASAYGESLASNGPSYPLYAIGSDHNATQQRFRDFVNQDMENKIW
jgi:hypothetical protein